MITSETSISKILTVPFSKEELSSMQDSRRSIINRRRYGKPIQEEVIETIPPLDKEEHLKSRIFEILEKLKPTPIIVKTDSFANSFITKEIFDRTDTNAIFEIITFTFLQFPRNTIRDLPPLELEHGRQMESGIVWFTSPPKDAHGYIERQTQKNLSGLTYKNQSLSDMLGHNIQIVARFLATNYDDALNAYSSYRDLQNIPSPRGYVSNTLSNARPVIWHRQKLSEIDTD